MEEEEGWLGLDQINGKRKQEREKKKVLKNGMVKEEMVDNKPPPPRFFLQPAIKMSPHTVNFFPSRREEKIYLKKKSLSPSPGKKKKFESLSR